MNTRQTHKGYSLIEVLVSVVVLALGFLGMTSLQTKSLQNNQNAVLRTQAAYLSYEMLEKIRGNPVANAIDIYVGNNGVTSATNCLTTSCDQNDLAAFDVLSWKCAINSSHCTNDVQGNLISTTSELPSGTGTIEKSGNNIKITISWAEGRPKLNPATNTLEAETAQFVLETSL